MISGLVSYKCAIALQLSAGRGALHQQHAMIVERIYISPPRCAAQVECQQNGTLCFKCKWVP